MEEALIRAAAREADKVKIIREYYANTAAFQLGELIFYIRGRMETMIRLYMRCMNTDKQHFESLREMHTLYIEVDHLMDMIDEFNQYDKDNPTEDPFDKPPIDPDLLSAMNQLRSKASSGEERMPAPKIEARDLRRRQIAYMERKMILRNMANGLGNTTSPRKKTMDINFEDGFDSDKY